MTTSTKLSVVAAFLLSATSLLGATSSASAAYCGWRAPPAPPNKIHVFCVRPDSVNDPILFGGGSIGSNRNLNNPLQSSRHYPHGPDPIKGEYLIAVWCPSCAPPPPPTPCCR